MSYKIVEETIKPNFEELKYDIKIFMRMDDVIDVKIWQDEKGWWFVKPIRDGDE